MPSSGRNRFVRKAARRVVSVKAARKVAPPKAASKSSSAQALEKVQAKRCVRGAVKAKPAAKSGPSGHGGGFQLRLAKAKREIADLRLTVAAKDEALGELAQIASEGAAKITQLRSTLWKERERSKSLHQELQKAEAVLRPRAFASWEGSPHPQARTKAAKPEYVPPEDAWGE